LEIDKKEDISCDFTKDQLSFSKKPRKYSVRAFSQKKVCNGLTLAKKAELEKTGWKISPEVP